MPIDCIELGETMRLACRIDPESASCIILTEMWEAFCGASALTSLDGEQVTGLTIKNARLLSARVDAGHDQAEAAKLHRDIAAEIAARSA